MTRSYSDQTYGGRHGVSFGTAGSIDGTYQSNTVIGRHTFMYPCKIVDFNLAILAGGTDLGADVFFYLGKQAAGTATTTVIGTADPLQGTGTHASNSVLDASVTETNFDAGDDVVLEAIGTIGHAMEIVPHLEVVENFQEADS